MSAQQQMIDKIKETENIALLAYTQTHFTRGGDV